MEKQNTPKIKLVRIKSWDKMVKEYGMDYGYIATNYNFTEDMRYLCEQIIFINEVDKNEFESDCRQWAISDDMIEEELDIQDYPEFLI